MKTKNENANAGVQDLCRRLKLQLEELSQDLGEEKSKADEEDQARREKLLERLKKQLADLSL